MRSIHSFTSLKALGDARRLAILRCLMRRRATLSQVGRELAMHPAQVRHHLKQLETAGLVELVSTKIAGSFVEKYYEATAHAFVINLAIVPDGSEEGAIVAMGSHDLALELMAEQLPTAVSGPDLFTIPVGSLDGLIALRQGMCQVAGCHLWDAASDEYNLPTVRHLFPGETMRLLTVAHRQQGLLVAAGNPRAIHTLADLARDDITFANRKRGTGTRLWLDQQLRHIGLTPQQVQGYDRELNTHWQVAQAVAGGEVDVGLGVWAAAGPDGLDFIPLFEERYELVMRATADSRLQPLLNYLQTADCRHLITSLAGYSDRHTGAERLTTV
jgi:molybdate-binding protein